MSMPTYDYRDLVTGQEERDPMAGTYSVLELFQEHKVRYVLRTKKGAIILRHMPLRMKRIIDSVSARIYPERAEMEKEAVNLLPYFDGIPEKDVEPEAKARMAELMGQLPLTDMSALGVVVAPALADMDDYETLYERLDEEDRIRLVTAVQALAVPRPVTDVDATCREIAKHAGIELMDEEMLQAMTVTQASYCMSEIAKEREAIDRMMNARRVG